MNSTTLRQVRAPQKWTPLALLGIAFIILIIIIQSAPHKTSSQQISTQQRTQNDSTIRTTIRNIPTSWKPVWTSQPNQTSISVLYQTTSNNRQTIRNTYTTITKTNHLKRVPVIASLDETRLDAETPSGETISFSADTTLTHHEFTPNTVSRELTQAMIPTHQDTDLLVLVTITKRVDDQ
jgi:hypothetical protein